MNYLFVLSENVIPVLIGSSYFFFGGKHWTSPFLISLVLPVLGFAMLFFIPNSPQYLVENGNLKEAEAELRKIANVNGHNLPYEFQIVRPEYSNCEDNITAKKRKLISSWV